MKYSLPFAIALSFVFTANANALDVSGIQIGTTLEEAKKVMLSLNRNYLNSEYPVENYAMGGVPAAYRVTAPCGNIDPAARCDETAIFQGPASLVTSIARYQRYPDPKSRFHASELISMLKNKYGPDSEGLIGKKMNPGEYSDGQFLWTFDRNGKQLRESVVNAQGYIIPGNCNFQSTQRTYNTFDTTFSTSVNEKCGKYIVAKYHSDENDFITAYKVEIVDVASMYDANLRLKQAADAVNQREVDAQRAKGLKPNL